MPVPGPTMIAAALSSAGGPKPWLFCTKIGMTSPGLAKSARKHEPMPLRGALVAVPAHGRHGEMHLVADAPWTTKRSSRAAAAGGRATSAGRAATASPRETPSGGRAGRPRPARPGPRRAPAPAASALPRHRRRGWPGTPCIRRSGGRCRPCSGAPRAAAGPRRRTPPSPRRWRRRDRARPGRAAGSCGRRRRALSPAS